MICPLCQKHFEPRAVNQIYCSHKCMCLVKRQRYCHSDEPPVPIDTRPIAEFVCKNCGKTVFIYSRFDQRSAYCCGKCYVKYRNKQALLRNVKKRGGNLGVSPGMSLSNLIRRERRDID